VENREPDAIDTEDSVENEGGSGAVVVSASMEIASGCIDGNHLTLVTT